jgi:phenylpropionate dioxygenase-like ring-hydroxylating dioxygenase large terminal subunit
MPGDSAADLPLVHDDGFVPKARYVDPAFARLEHERLWRRVWQVAGREEEVADAGAVLPYEIGDQSVVVARAGDGTLHAFHNACLHRGTRLVTEPGVRDGACSICPYHGWTYDATGRLCEVPDRDEFPDLPPGLALAPVRVATFGGFVFVNLDVDAPPLHEFLGPLPDLLAPYHLDRMRLRAALTTIIPANWKAVVDAFNESYHVQAAHSQILPWTDDTTIAYEQVGIHARYGRLEGARRELRPSPRLGLDEDAWDEGEILAGMVEGLGGAFLGDERALVDELRAAGLPRGELLGAYQQRRMELLAARGLDVSGFTPDRMTSAEDVYWFPNLVGPIYPGSAILFRVRPNGLDPDSALKDTWVLEWPDPQRPPREPTRRRYDDWRERDWGEITTQDYENLARVQAGMHSDGFRGARLAERQEANILHMHRTIDAYLTGAR